MLKGYSSVRYFGEASTYYTIADFGEKNRVPARMKKANPNMRLIYILRSPFMRIVSSYLHAHRAGYFKGNFAEYIETDHYERALLTSRYWYQLARYLRLFPKNQIKVALFEDLIDDCQSVMEDMFRFLELEPEGPISIDVHNRSKNRADFKATELLFPTAAFEAARRVIEPEVRRLEDFMQRSMSVWDLSEEQWCATPTPSEEVV